MSDFDNGKSLEQYAKEYIVTKRNIRETEKDLKDLKTGSDKAKELKEHWEKVKSLRAEINGDDDVLDTKGKLNELKDTLKLQEEMIVFRLKEQQLSLFELEDEGKFTLNNKLKYKAFRKKKKFRF